MPTSFLSLDVGTDRIGLATANSIARIAAPLPALDNDASLFTALQDIIKRETIAQLVVGWPRSLSGEETEQTHYVEGFIAQLQNHCPLPVSRQDEALTSVRAEAELTARKTAYTKGDIDSLSAVYILEDYLQEHQ